MDVPLEALLKQFRMQRNVAHHEFMMIETSPNVIKILRIVLELVNVVISTNKHLPSIETLQYPQAPAGNGHVSQMVHPVLSLDSRIPPVDHRFIGLFAIRERPKTTAVFFQKRAGFVMAEMRVGNQPAIDHGSLCLVYFYHAVSANAGFDVELCTLKAIECFHKAPIIKDFCFACIRHLHAFLNVISIGAENLWIGPEANTIASHGKALLGVEPQDSRL